MASEAPEKSNTSKSKRPPPPLSRRGLFVKELQPMMYGFGDAPISAQNSDTVNTMEDILVDYITEVCQTAASVSTNKGKIKMDDVRFALRKPHAAKQLARVEELLIMDVEIKKARHIGHDDFAEYAKNKFGADEQAEEPESGLASLPGIRKAPKKERRKD